MKKEHNIYRIGWELRQYPLTKKEQKRLYDIEWNERKKANRQHNLELAMGLHYIGFTNLFRS